MKAKVERDVFLKALMHVSNVADRQSVPHILGNVLLQLSPDGASSLCATDSEVELHETLDVVVEEGGATTVPAQVLHQVVDKLPAGAEIELVAEGKAAQAKGGGELQLRCGKAKFRLQSLPSDEFPFLSKEGPSAKQEKDNPICTFRVPGKDMHRLFAKTRSAIADAGPRYYLQGVYLHRAEEDGVFLRAVATDGHRLARVQAEVKDLPADLPPVIVPRKAVNELMRLLEENKDSEVELSFSANKISFTMKSQRLTSKLIDGQFPDYSRVIPQDNDKQAKVDVKNFGRKIASVSAISQDTPRSVRAVRLKLEPDVMHLESTDSETGSGTDELSIAYAADAVKIGFNANYLRDIAEQIDGDTVSMEFKDANSPALLRDDGDANALYILMPMRV